MEQTGEFSGRSLQEELKREVKKRSRVEWKVWVVRRTSKEEMRTKVV